MFKTFAASVVLLYMLKWIYSYKLNLRGYEKMCKLILLACFCCCCFFFQHTRESNQKNFSVLSTTKVSKVNASSRFILAIFVLVSCRNLTMVNCLPASWRDERNINRFVLEQLLLCKARQFQHFGINLITQLSVLMI